MRNLTIEELLLINQYVQKIVLETDIKAWFSPLSEDEKQSIVKNLWMLAIQAQVVESDVNIAAENIGLKKTHTPVVMLLKGEVSFQNRGYRLYELKGIVLEQAILLALECFSLAESRRKLKKCGTSCNHWWHRDLSNDSIVNEIIKDMTINLLPDELIENAQDLQ